MCTVFCGGVVCELRESGRHGPRGHGYGPGAPPHSKYDMYDGYTLLKQVSTAAEIEQLLGVEAAAAASGDAKAKYCAATSVAQRSSYNWLQSIL